MQRNGGKAVTVVFAIILLVVGLTALGGLFVSNKQEDPPDPTEFCDTRPGGGWAGSLERIGKTPMLASPDAFKRTDNTPEEFEDELADMRAGVEKFADGERPMPQSAVEAAKAADARGIELCGKPPPEAVVN